MNAVSTRWQAGRFRLDLSTPKIMGIVNVTPDSFSDGGVHGEPSQALAHCERLVAEGADILDIGGESTRPGALEVSADEEMARVLPVIRGAMSLGVPLSVDTFKPVVMRAALEAGVDVVNCIAGFRESGAVEAVSAHPACGVCVMHMQGEPRSMQSAPHYQDVVTDVLSFLRNRTDVLLRAGIAADRIVLDPGIGFGKTPAHNWALLRRQRELMAAGHPLLIGWSRKSTLGHLTGRSVADRGPGSLAASLAAVHLGASILRVHDVAATVDALKVWDAAGLIGSTIGADRVDGDMRAS